MEISLATLISICDFSLEFNTNLATNTWSVASPPPSVSGPNYVVTNAASGLQKHYRLRNSQLEGALAV